MRAKINDFVYGSSGRAVLSMTVLSAVFISAIIGIGLLVINFDQPLGLTMFTVGQIVVTLITLWLMRKLDVFNSTDFTLKGKAKGFLLGWIFILVQLGSVVMTAVTLPEGALTAPDPLHLVMVILHPFIGTGLFEEVLFRGLVLLVLLKVMGQTKKGVVKAVIISSVIFGVVHLANLVVADVLPVVTQVFYASAVGVLFAALYLRTKTLWIPIIYHGFVNVSLQIWSALIDPNAMPQENGGGGLNVIVLLVAIVYLVAGLILLKKVTPDGIVVSESCTE